MVTTTRYFGCVPTPNKTILVDSVVFIAGHPNVKVFVTQGGLQSAEEAIFNGVPLVVMPFFGDQRANSKSMMDLGIALEVDSNFLTKEKLKKAIEDVAGDNK